MTNAVDETADLDVDLDVDSTDETDEVDTTEVPAGETGEVEAKAAKAAKANKRAALPEGYVTPIGLCKAINEQGLYTGEGELKPQAVYSYIRNAPKAHPFPEGKLVKDLVEGAEDDTRVVYLLEEGLAWWKAKNERAATRKQNAAEKATKAAEKAAAKPVVEAEGESTEVEVGEVQEAE